MAKYNDLLKIGYPLVNPAYVVAVNNKVLEDQGEVVNNQVDINGGLEADTVIILKEAGLMNKANKVIK